MPPSPKPARQSKRSTRLGGTRANLVQASIYKISEAASSATSLDDLFRAIHVAVSELMPAQNFYIALYDSVAGRLTFPYFVDEVDAPPPPRPVGRGSTEYVLRTGRPLLASPGTAAELERAGEIELIGSPSIDWLGVPLKTQDTTFGVLVVQSYTEGVRYTEEDKTILMFVSGQVAMAIARTRAEQALLSTVEVLKVRGASPEEMATTAAELEAHAKRGAALTRQLLLFARREVVKPERVDFNRVVAEATNLLRRLVRENIRLTLAPASEPLLLDADWGQLEQILVNLVVNTTDAMPAGGDLLISTGKLGEAEVWLEVGDTGVGIPEAVREKIFEPFFTTKAAEHGTGLGLAVVHGIVEQHRGRLEVRSAVGRGSTFRVILPCASGPEAAVTHRAEPSTTKQGRGERVLVVEDEEEARKALKEIIEMLGFQVTAAGSGEEAEEIGRAEPFDVLLTDFVLPGIDGAELARRLRDAISGLRVILMSGYAEDDSVRASVSSGSTHLLQKPFDVNTLSRTLWLALE